MRKVEEYKRHAADCRKLARTALNEETKQQLFQMAETWDSLARDRAEQIKREQRIASLEGKITGEA